MSDPLAAARPRALPEAGLRTLRPLVRTYLRRRWDLHVDGVEHVPAEGPVIFASNHIGWLDGPLLILCTPRPAHALVKVESFEGRTGLLLRFAGQIPLDRFRRDVGALRTAAGALAAGQSVVIYPEGVRGAGDVARTKDGVAWLALVSGAPVVPVAIFGTRPAGGHAEARPPRGARLDIVYGGPFRVAQESWPRTRARVAEVGGLVQEHLQRHVRRASESGPRVLPGPLPSPAGQDAADHGAVPAPRLEGSTDV